MTDYSPLVELTRPVRDLPPLVCGGCTLCCKRSIVALIPDLDEPASTYETDKIASVHVLKHKENGDCIYLGPGGCTIYERRPAVCREFDCRGLARRYSMKQWKIIAKTNPNFADLAMIRQGKRLLRKLQ